MRRAIFIACCILCSVTALAQVYAASPQSEQDEHGFTHFEGTRVAYSIRLLPVSSFPQLPLAVSEQLERLGCMIPQTYEARGPENVINGAFEKQGSSDWAALCSVKGITTLYVFFQSDFSRAIALRRQSDSQWVGTEWSHDYGSAWGIATMHSDELPRTDQVDHDGIQDSYIEQSSTIHYFQNGHWTTLDTDQ